MVRSYLTRQEHYSIIPYVDDPARVIQKASTYTPPTCVKCAPELVVASYRESGAPPVCLGEQQFVFRSRRQAQRTGSTETSSRPTCPTTCSCCFQKFRNYSRHVGPHLCRLGLAKGDSRCLYKHTAFPAGSVCVSAWLDLLLSVFDLHFSSQTLQFLTSCLSPPPHTHSSTHSHTLSSI